MSISLALIAAVIGSCLVVGSSIMRIHNLPKPNSVLAAGVILTITSAMALI